MSFLRRSLYLAFAATLCAATTARADHNEPSRQLPMPTQRSALPPTPEQTRYNLPPTHHARTDLQIRGGRQLASTATTDCKDMSKLAGYSGAALADYVAALPDYECTYPLFSVDASLAGTIFSSANMSAVVSRFTSEASAYNATNMALVNLALYLRAAYYQAGSNAIPAPAASLTTSLRTPIQQLVAGSALYVDNAAASTTAGEVIRLITNMHDEPYYLPTMKGVVQRFTGQNAAQLTQASAGGGFTSVLTVIYYGHFRPDGITLLQNDLSYPTALNNFVVQNKSTLLGGAGSYQLHDAAVEAFRFLQYDTLKSSVRPMVQNTLNTSTMTGADSDLWIAAASSVKYYDEANCSLYGTCNFQSTLADAVLKYSYTCSPTLHIRAQDMTSDQLQSTCGKLATEEGYFHTMLQTNQTPVANDRNTSLELVVFDDYTNYSKYAGVIYDMSTDNGGMYLEGDPTNPNNQARFVAHEASWLRPTFQIWNLEHEYVHYLDGRFDMYGDFTQETVQPTVWWIEGLAEYLSQKNNNQAAIDAAQTGQYKLSTIFANTYGMPDYVNRAYRWGYMAVRFMNERHRADIDAVLPDFRSGDYDSYQAYMNGIGTRYDTEFASWVSAATTAGDPPLPVPQLPACSSSSQLGKNCAISNLASSTQSYLYLMLPSGATNVKLQVYGGTGDADIYVALDRYPTTSDYDAASLNVGNRETISLTSPVSGHWYYIVLKAKQPYSGVSVGATYD